MKFTVTITDYPSPFYPFQFEWKADSDSGFKRTEVFANKDNAILFAKSLYKNTTIVDKTACNAI